MWPIIALLVTLARGLPRNCAGPTALPDDFLLPEAEALDCGLPVSRSYLLSAHNMVLVVEAPAEAPVAGEPYSMTVRGCDAAAPGPWTDAYSFAAPDFAWCDPDALELWARARGPTIEVADVTPSATECAWTLAFPRGLAAGDYEIDVLNIWLRGWAEPAKEPERERKGVALAGEPFDWRSPPLKRGSSFMPCVQRCMLFEQYPPGKPPWCHMFSRVDGDAKVDDPAVRAAAELPPGRPQMAVPTPARNATRDELAALIAGANSGPRRPEPVVKYLGGIINAKNGWTTKLLRSPCRRQAHALGSPVAAAVAAGPAAPPAPRPACPGGDAPGRWVRLDCGATAAAGDAAECAEIARQRAAPPHAQYKVDADWDYGYAWRPYDCDAKRRPPAEAVACLKRRNVSAVVLAGDSLMQACAPQFFEAIGGAVGEDEKKVAARAGVEVFHERMDFGPGADGRVLRRLEERVPAGGLGIVFANFAVQHLEWGKTSREVEALVEGFAKNDRVRDLTCRREIRTQFVQFGGVAVHGFREPYCTYNRSRAFSDLIRRGLAPLGWGFVDAWNPSSSRPEGSKDGMHVHGPTCRRSCALPRICRDGARSRPAAGS
ncbi:hypothetical protein JL721_447 [Aureococcus anophagefferens]|nr:hypothetical protein JL721_447 [Aureococcus anophagefferens]